MSIIIMALLGVLLAYLMVRFGPLSQRKAESSGETVTRERIGDRLRRLEANKKKYAVMTQSLLEETPDEELIEAVLSNLWAKMRPDMKDALDVIQRQSMERQTIFALYAVTGGVKQAGFEKLKESPDAVLLPTALGALDSLEMTQTISLLRSAMETEDADQYQTPYTDSFDGEGGREKMIAYIRENPDGFLDS